MLWFLVTIAIVLFHLLSDSNHFNENELPLKGVKMEGFAAWRINCLDNWVIAI